MNNCAVSGTKSRCPGLNRRVGIFKRDFWEEVENGLNFVGHVGVGKPERLEDVNVV